MTPFPQFHSKMLKVRDSILQNRKNKSHVMGSLAQPLYWMVRIFEGKKIFKKKKKILRTKP